MSFFDTQVKFHDTLKPGDRVLARFTNCGRNHQFKGEIVGITKNYFKVKCLENFRKADMWDRLPELSDEVARVFRIDTVWSRTHSVNNCVAEIHNKNNQDN